MSYTRIKNMDLYVRDITNDRGFDWNKRLHQEEVKNVCGYNNEADE